MIEKNILPPLDTTLLYTVFFIILGIAVASLISQLPKIFKDTITLLMSLFRIHAKLLVRVIVFFFAVFFFSHAVFADSY